MPYFATHDNTKSNANVFFATIKYLTHQKKIKNIVTWYAYNYKRFNNNRIALESVRHEKSERDQLAASGKPSSYTHFSRSLH